MLAACSNDSSNAVTLSSPNEVTEDQGTEQTPGMNSDLVTQTGSETQIETESGTETGTGTENGTGTDATTGPETGSEAGAGTETNGGADSESDTGTESEPVAPEISPETPEQPEVQPEAPQQPEVPPEPPEQPEVPPEPLGPPGPPEPSEGPPGPPEPEGPTGESIPGEDLIGDTVVENFVATQGISLEVTRYATNQSGSPQIELKLNYNSPTAIFNSVCELTALENDQNIDVTSATFAEGGPIDSGESAISIADFAGLANGYSSISTIRIGCEWSVGDNNGQDIVNGAVTVTFTTFSSDSGRPTIGLMLTNNSPVAVNMAVCGVEAKRSNIIADVATAVFAELGDISSGAAVEATGIWSRLNSLNEFDSEQFNINNVNCRYQ